MFLALSCLQGWPMQKAAAELIALGAPGLQLTPGCAPTPAFGLWLDHMGVATRPHDGFAWRALRRSVWDEAGNCLVASESVHPPRLAGDGRTPDSNDRWMDAASASGVAVEVMYPGHLLGTGDEIDNAIARGLSLAVDVSHLHIQRTAGVLSNAQLARVLAYPAIAEVHVSANDGRHDLHRPVGPTSYGLGWARERAADGVPLVCESYLHRLSADERRAFVDELLALVQVDAC